MAHLASPLASPLAPKKAPVVDTFVRNVSFFLSPSKSAVLLVNAPAATPAKISEIPIESAVSRVIGTLA